MNIFKDTPIYEGYQASRNGYIRSVDRVVVGVNGIAQNRTGKVLKPSINRDGYPMVTFQINGVRKTETVHMLVMMTWAGHMPQGKGGLTVDHINGIKTDNRLDNLQLISSRQNTVKSQNRGESKYIGVTRKGKKWMARIVIEGQRKYLGVFKTEIEASNAYQNELKNIINGS